MRNEPEIRLGVIGVGGRGELIHWTQQADLNARVVAGADINPAALRAFRDRYGPRVFVTADPAALLARAEVDAVFVTTPDHLHAPLTIAALDAGKHVYVEKPMALSIADCDAMRAAAQRNDRCLYVGHNMRHMRFTQTLRAIIASGRIGTVKAAWCRHFVSYGGDAFFKDWHCERRYSNSLLLAKGAHDLDILHWLGGGYATLVQGLGGLTLYGHVGTRRNTDEPPDTSWDPARWPPERQTGLNPRMDTEDLSHVQLRLTNDVYAAYLQCNYTPDAWRNYCIIGSAGRVENVGGERYIGVWTRRTDGPHEPDEVVDSDTFAAISAAADRQSDSGHGGADARIVAEFLRHLRGDDDISVTALDARQAVATAACATDSLRAGGRPVPVPAGRDCAIAGRSK